MVEAERLTHCDDLSEYSDLPVLQFYKSWSSAVHIDVKETITTTTKISLVTLPYLKLVVPACHSHVMYFNFLYLPFYVKLPVR